MTKAIITSSLALAATAFVATAQTRPGSDPTVPPVPGSNLPPAVQIASPPNGAVFVAPANILISAMAADRDGQVVSVEFFEGTNSLGISLPPPPPLPPPTNGGVLNEGILPRPPFSLLWSNVPVGVYRLCAVATDNQGAVGRSQIVQVNIRETPTNKPPEVPVVNITAVDAWGAEATNHPSRNAIFVVSRSGPTNAEVTILLAIAGSASNGVDYVEIPRTVTIATGKREAAIVIEPIDDTLVEGTETVAVGLLPPPPVTITIYPPPPPPYKVGSRPRAVAYITDNDRPANLPPYVALIYPRNQQRFPVGANVPLRADAYDRDGSIASVDFFSGDTLLGTATNRPYGMVWNGVAEGSYVLKAKATDNKGATAVSAPVTIEVGAIVIPPPTNRPPTNIIVRPPTTTLPAGR